MPVQQEVKQRAYELDPEAWASYSNQPREIKTAMEARRKVTLERAQRETLEATEQRVDPYFDWTADFAMAQSNYYSCKKCAALVYEGNLDEHVEWHSQVFLSQGHSGATQTATDNRKENATMAKPTVSLSLAEAAATAKALSGLTKKNKTIEKVIEKLSATPAA